MIGMLCGQVESIGTTGVRGGEQEPQEGRMGEVLDNGMVQRGAPRSLFLRLRELKP
jgi:hypothetical protein